MDEWATKASSLFSNIPEVEEILTDPNSGQDPFGLSSIFFSPNAAKQLRSATT